jgi:CRP-like cAMP-binding protein
MGEVPEEPITRWERLLDIDADLADALGPDIAAHARARVGVATVELPPGSWRPENLVRQMHGPFGLIVCKGLIVRELDLAGTLTTDLLGPGDIVALGRAGDGLLATAERWHVSGQATVAILDERILPALHVWPALGSRLIARAARQAARAAEQRAISQLPRVELRIRALLWHLAERWGRMGPSGVVVPLELTHGALGHLVGARRPTVTLALSELARDGAVVRREDGAWILRHDSNPSMPAVDGDRPVPIVTLLPGMTHLPPRSRPMVTAQVDARLLAERVQHVRVLNTQQLARSAAILRRCAATRAVTARTRASRVNSRAA